MIKLTIKNNYGIKDQIKSNLATQFIGRGSENSSTNQYRLDWGNKANTGIYNKEDVVFISAEGNRKNRLKPDFDIIQKAVLQGVSFVTDSLYNRNRDYNIGEREVAEFLIKTHEPMESSQYALWVVK